MPRLVRVLCPLLLGALSIACSNGPGVDRATDSAVTLRPAAGLINVSGAATIGLATDLPVRIEPAANPNTNLSVPLEVAANPNTGSSFTLAVAANPHNVLSAAATVGWPEGVVSIRIQATSDSVPFEATPPQSVSPSGGTAPFPILGLQPSTRYTAVAVGTDSAGHDVTSAPVDFQTGPLPSDLPAFTVAGSVQAGPGYTLVARLSSDATPYLTIVDGTGAPVWYVRADAPLGGDFQRQPNNTYTMAIAQAGAPIPGLSQAAVTFRQVDLLGNTLRDWVALDFDDPATGGTVHPTATDGHDLRLQPNGDAVFFGLLVRPAAEVAQGSSSSTNYIGNVLERVTPDGKVAFAWNAFDYLDVANIDPVATSTTAANVDFTHANSVDVMADGSYLVGFRNLSQVIKIDAQTGAILWKLGGRDGQFQFVNDPLGGFSCQHGARELPNGHIILFDDGDGHSPKQSRAVEYALDTNAMTATLVWSGEDTPALFSTVLGFAQRLTTGNSLVTFGTTLHVQEFGPDGSVVWELTDPSRAFGIYRAFRIDSLY